MPLPDSLLHTLAHRLSKHLGRTVTVDRETPVGGGSISDSYLLDTTAGRYFVKVDPAPRTATGAPHFPSMFAAEADGLERLASTRAIRIPKVIATGDEDFGYLLLERIECRPTTSASGRFSGTPWPGCTGTQPPTSVWIATIGSARSSS
ncbi:MAG: fructosamine kinase family protein [Bacteroidetes bacterium]|jgi:fructosamine-3-kinase|nr:fructosamine kinase family protein [Bacteroidota bacterium]HMU12521.1 fructosamine kinase family protein [Flavobacteriales bacterium]